LRLHGLVALALLMPLHAWADPSLGRWTTSHPIGITDSGQNWISAEATPATITSSILGSYFIRIDAPANAVVPVGVDYLFDGHVSADLGAGATVLDTFKVVNVFTDTLSFGINTNGTATGGAVGKRHREMQLVGGGTYQVQMIVNATVVGNIVNATHPDAYAYVDPYFAIDPDFLSSHPGYSISFSDGVINAVPEPGTAAFLVLGLGALCARIRRRTGMASP
jgi:MYXO-CTERM domain-containing protein